jgi:hypothetical protein
MLFSGSHSSFRKQAVENWLVKTLLFFFLYLAISRKRVGVTEFDGPAAKKNI